MNKYLFFALFMCPVFLAEAQNISVKLSLGEAVQLFSGNNLELIAERYNIDIAEAQVIQAKLLENPTISLEQNIYNRNNGKYFDVGREGEAAVEIEQLIYIAGQRNKRIRLEKINKEASVFQFKEVVRTLNSELKTKFINLYYARKSLSVYDREIEYLNKLLDVLKEQNLKGNVSLLEKSRVQALLLSLQQEKNETCNQAVSLQGELKLLLGITNHTDIIEPVFDESAADKIDINSTPFSELTAQLSERPDIKATQAFTKASEANIRLQKALAFPEVSVKGIYDRAGNFCDNYFAIGLNVSVPLFNRNQGNIKAARLSALQNSTRETQAKLQAENELYTSYSSLERAIQLYRSSNYELERDFNTIMEGVNTNFQKRNISLLELIDYYQVYKETCLQLYNTRKNVFTSAEEVNMSVGQNIFKY